MMGVVGIHARPFQAFTLLQTGRSHRLWRRIHHFSRPRRPSHHQDSYDKSKIRQRASRHPQGSPYTRHARPSQRMVPSPLVDECFSLIRLQIISLLAFHDDDASHTLQLHVPYVSLSLETILDQPHFTPSDNKYFQTVSRAIMYQVLLGVSYLHSAPHRIAHRDLKPSNVLITLSGCIQLIDFGVSYDPNPDPQDIWHEDERRMYFEVSTGYAYLLLYLLCKHLIHLRPYRAPELLFGTRSYNPYATDMWSLGCLFSDFFTPLVTEEEEEGYSDYPSEGGPSLTRKTLFDAGRGEIALIWSIFKTMGTPTTVTWPVGSKSGSVGQILTV